MTYISIDRVKPTELGSYFSGLFVCPPVAVLVNFGRFSPSNSREVMAIYSPVRSSVGVDRIDSIQEESTNLNFRYTGELNHLLGDISGEPSVV